MQVLSYFQNQVLLLPDIFSLPDIFHAFNSHFSCLQSLFIHGTNLCSFSVLSIYHLLLLKTIFRYFEQNLC